ncbi:MAG: hypothetical protein AAFZ15_17175 [Bacteroidota bacterium]
MQSERLGIVTFFGIFIPGSYLAGTLVLGLACFLAIFGIDNSHGLIIAYAKGSSALFTAIFIFISYLLGVVIRLYAPDSVDSLSTFYLTKIRKRKELWVKEPFPYTKSMQSRFEKSGMGEVIVFLKKLNKEFSNKSYFNYCKLLIIAKSPALSRQVQQAEALVRFLSGTIWVLRYIGIWVAPIGLITFILKGNHKLAVFYAGFLFVSLIVLLLILERFKYQRRKEVQTVWSSIYLIFNELQDKHSVENDQKSSDS